MCYLCYLTFHSLFNPIHHHRILSPTSIYSYCSPESALWRSAMISILLTQWALFQLHLTWFLCSISPYRPLPPSWNSLLPCGLWYFLLVFLISLSQPYNIPISPQTPKTLVRSRSLLCLYPHLGWSRSLLPLYQYAVLKIIIIKIKIQHNKKSQTSMWQVNNRRGDQHCMGRLSLTDEWPLPGR